ncbi:MAG: hypothetical protein K0R83_1925 [Caulobacter sp.]|jgi:hypothetical protein|nr:hypothetical protein [Caulobacter sp.]
MTDDRTPTSPDGWWSRLLSWLDGFAEGSWGAELDALRDRVETLEQASAGRSDATRP